MTQERLINRTVREQWILNETVKALFDNESLLIVFQGVNITDEGYIDYSDKILEQKRKELRKRLLSHDKIPLNANSCSIDIPVVRFVRGALDVCIDDGHKCEVLK